MGGRPQDKARRPGATAIGGASIDYLQIILGVISVLLSATAFCYSKSAKKTAADAARKIQALQGLSWVPQVIDAVQEAFSYLKPAATSEDLRLVRESFLTAHNRLGTARRGGANLTVDGRRLGEIQIDILNLAFEIVDRADETNDANERGTLIRSAKRRLREITQDLYSLSDTLYLQAAGIRTEDIANGEAS